MAEANIADGKPLFKKSKRKSNLRKRPAEHSSTIPDDSASAAATADVFSKQAGEPISGSDEESDIDTNASGLASRHNKRRRGIAISSSRKKADWEDEQTHFKILDETKHYVKGENATREAEWDTEKDRDSQAILQRKVEAQQKGKRSDEYKGQASYQTYINPTDSKFGNAASTKNRSTGPIRAPSNIRSTTVFDYQPDICKDYKETGFCGYGDSCIYLHDRGDYKSGWQLEKEWEEMQKNGGRRDDPRLYEIPSESEGDSSDEELPFACLICRKEFVSPVETKCGHYFCEACALKHYRKTPKCFACGAPTSGIFMPAKKLIAKLEQKHARQVNDGVSGGDGSDD
ncbi:RNA-splicing factor [Spiromyces aspiralis]|uniref:RNA-splicing factor n=1 Tax=Spiromyces aspiralis TaxID=68401 RepID=A0ACC1HP09_9FUNG|nr:RNA-splicing factor [Spiromyces aspiralis]